MLAMDYEPDKISFPVIGQPKLDGIRAMASCGRNGFVVLHTRGFQRLKLPHIEQALGDIMREGDVWDGELYVHGVHFDDIKRMIRCQDEALQFHVFDSVSDDPFTQRYTKLPVMDGPVLHRVAVNVLHTSGDMNAYRAEQTGSGYEGIILRQPDAGYKHARTYAMMRIKETEDNEFFARDYSLPRDGSVVFDCVTANGQSFRARLADVTKANADVHAGIMVTVRHKGWTSNGLPREPRALRIRPAYDLPLAA